MPYARSWRPTGKNKTRSQKHIGKNRNSSRSITRRSWQKTIATHFEKEASSKKEELAAQEGPGEDEAGSDPSSEESSESSDATRTKNVVEIWCRWCRSVQKPNLLRRVPVSVPNQSRGKCLMWRLGYLYVTSSVDPQLRKIRTQLHPKDSKGAPSCICMRRKVNRMHSIRWRRRVSHYKRSMKLFVFTLLIVRTELWKQQAHRDQLELMCPQSRHTCSLFLMMDRYDPHC